MDKTETVRILEDLRESFHPKPEIATETLEIYRNVFCEFAPEVLQAAAVLIAKTSKWWPAISELRAACLEISGERAELPAVGEAYSEARRAAGTIGAYKTPTGADFSHPIVQSAALQSAGSWRRWCLTDDEAEAPLRARFFQCYAELRDREITQQALPESARQLTAEESRRALEDVHNRSEAKRLGWAKAAPLTPIHQLMKKEPPIKAAIVGDDMTDEEWTAKKAEILEAAR